MKHLLLPTFLLLLPTLDAAEAVPPNRLIDYKGFLANAGKVEKLREQRRVSEEEFLRMAAEPGTIILDARSPQRFEMLHVAGARHLDLTETTAQTLAEVIPTKGTRILIYCNNNFLQAPEAFASKVAPASLNIYTFNTLYSYGYENVYELGPLMNIRDSKLPFAGKLAKAYGAK